MSVTTGAGVTLALEAFLERASSLTRDEARSIAASYRRRDGAVAHACASVEFALQRARHEGAWTDADTDRLQITLSVLRLAVAEHSLRRRDAEALSSALALAAGGILATALVPSTVSLSTLRAAVSPWVETCGPLRLGP